MIAEASAPIWVAIQTSGFGGTEAHTVQLVQALCESGREVRVISIGNHVLDGKLAHQRARIVHIDGNLMSHSPADWRELEAHFQSRPGECSTLILQRGGISIGTAPALRMLRRYFNRLYLVQHSMPPIMRARRFTKLLGIFPIPSLWWLNEWKARRAPSRYAEKVIAVSGAVARALKEEYFYPASKVVIVHNGVFIENFRIALAARTKKNLIAESKDYPQMVFGMLTRLDKVKGIDIALRAFHLLQSRRPSYSTAFVIFGDGEEEASLKDLANQLGIDDKVKFAGFASKSDQACGSLDVIVLSSRSEGLPLALLEGMASGCIPIVTNVGGMPEVVDNPKIGYVVEPNAEAICLAMCSVLDMSATEQQAMRTAAANRIREAFDARKALARLISVVDGSDSRKR